MNKKWSRARLPLPLLHDAVKVVLFSFLTGRAGKLPPEKALVPLPWKGAFGTHWTKHYAMSSPMASCPRLTLVDFDPHSCLESNRPKLCRC